MSKTHYKTQTQYMVTMRQHTQLSELVPLFSCLIRHNFLLLYQNVCLSVPTAAQLRGAGRKKKLPSISTLPPLNEMFIKSACSRHQSVMLIMNSELCIFLSGISFTKRPKAAYVTLLSSRCSLLGFMEHPGSAAPQCSC